MYNTIKYATLCYAKNDAGCCPRLQATDERLIALRYLMRISAHLAFSQSAQKMMSLGAKSEL